MRLWIAYNSTYFCQSLTHGFQFPKALCILSTTIYTTHNQGWHVTHSPGLFRLIKSNMWFIRLKLGTWQQTWNKSYKPSKFCEGHTLTSKVMFLIVTTLSYLAESLRFLIAPKPQFSKFDHVLFFFLNRTYIFIYPWMSKYLAQKWTNNLLTSPSHWHLEDQCMLMCSSHTIQVIRPDGSLIHFWTDQNWTPYFDSLLIQFWSNTVLIKYSFDQIHFETLKKCVKQWLMIENHI